MSEYIEKEAAATIPVLPKEHRKYQTMNLDDAYENGWYDALECVEKIPPADVRPVKHGKWIPVTNGRGGHECSECHNYAPSYQSGNEYLSRFCPVCGSENNGTNR